MELGRYFYKSKSSIIVVLLQVLSHKKITASSVTRFRLLISDGMYSNSYAMLATQLNDMIMEGRIPEYTIIRVNKLQCNTMQGKKVIIIMGADVVRSGSQVGQRLGTPVAINAAGTVSEYDRNSQNFLRENPNLTVMENGTTTTTIGTLTKLGLSQYAILPVKIEAYGRVFITSSSTVDGVYYQWVKLLGSPSEAKDFIFSLEYKGLKCTHVFLGEVASINETLEEMISSDGNGKCSSIGFRTFKSQFMEGNTSKYHWSITVKRLDE